MYDFDKVVDRRGTSSIKWNFQNSFGQQSGLLPFWIADTDFATVPEITEAIQKRCSHPVIGYSDPLPSVYEAIQGWWDRRHGWKADTSWMLLSYGVVTAIYFTLETLVPKGEKVLVFTPVYDPFFAAVNNSGRQMVDCPLDHKDNSYTINWELLEKELADGVRAIVFCNPHNPIGRVWTYEEMERLCELCVKYDVYLLSDEIHADFGFTRKYTTAGRFPKTYNKLVVYTAISKTFNMAGLGSSCMIIPNPELKQKIQDAYDSRWMFGPSDLAFTAMEAAYRHGDRWVDEQCEYLRGNGEIVRAFMAEKLPKVQVTTHEGTFLMWLDMTCFGKTSGELTTILAKEYGLALGDGSHYGKQAEGFMRFNIGCARETLQKGLDQLAKFYSDYIK
ncbi:MAG: putative C-S lyase [Angelakisella sp.]|jgi:cystathionine beta-lyase|nr:putative C-S lyase [Angelakisella sp.]